MKSHESRVLDYKEDFHCNPICLFKYYVILVGVSQRMMQYDKGGQGCPYRFRHGGIGPYGGPKLVTKTSKYGLNSENTFQNCARSAW